MSKLYPNIKNFLIDADKLGSIKGDLYKDKETGLYFIVDGVNIFVVGETMLIEQLVPPPQDAIEYDVADF